MYFRGARHLLEVLRNTKTDKTKSLKVQSKKLNQDLNEIISEGKELVSFISKRDKNKDHGFIYDRLSEIENHKKQIEQELYTLEYKIKEILSKTEDASIICELLSNFRNRFSDAPSHMQKAWIKLIIKKVIYSPKEIELQIYDDIEQLGVEMKKTTESNFGTGCFVERTKWLPEHPNQRTSYHQFISQ
ncbi:hypothetical protein KAJ27_17720 [bacterium]|nr:hypothetical protein [bacterium]